jgi:hypothetical protein
MTYTIDDIIKAPQFFGEASASFQNAFSEAIGPQVLGSPEQGTQLLNLGRGGRVLSILPGDDFQKAVNYLHVLGGGTVFLGGGQHNWRFNPTLYSNIAVKGDNVGTVVDFGGGAYQFQIVGSNPYSTGTLAVSSGATSVVGTGTAWTAAMIGRSILIQDLWYEITAVTDTTHLTIGSTFAGTVLSGATYVIADIIESVSISGITVQNSSVALIKARYFDDLVLEDVFFSAGAAALDADDSSGLQVLGCFGDSCIEGFNLANCRYGAFNNSSAFNITGGNALTLTNCSNWSSLGLSFEQVVGQGISLDGTTDFTLDSITCKNITGKGIEFVANCNTISLLNATVRYCSSDGVKLTASSDGIAIYGCAFDNNTGYGVNIAAATCDNNEIEGNVFSSNTAGDINDLGTLTIKVGNSPVALNTSTYNPGGTDVAVADGGTGASTAANARTNLGVDAAGTAASLIATHEADTTSVHGITDTSTLYRAGGTDVAVADGGTGASTAATARSNLGVAPVTAKYIVQTADSELNAEQALAALATGVVKNTTTTGVLSIAANSDLPAMSATVGGAVPTPPNDTTKFLRGDGTFAVPPTSTPVYKNGTTTKDLSDASTTQNIAHGIGATPKYVRLTASFDPSAGITGSYTPTIVFSVYNGTTQSSGGSALESEYNVVTTFKISNGNATNQVGVITFDATNIIITWTKTGSPVGTANLLWEAFG